MDAAVHKRAHRRQHFRRAVPLPASSDSDDPDLRFGVSPDGTGFYTRGEFLARCGPIDGTARWNRAEPPCAGDSPASSGAATSPAADSDGDANSAAGSDVAYTAGPASGDGAEGSDADASCSDEASQKSSDVPTDFPGRRVAPDGTGNCTRTESIGSFGKSDWPARWDRAEPPFYGGDFEFSAPNSRRAGIP